MRTIVDRGLLEWEEYASASRHGGLQDRPRVVFHCLTSPALRPRFVERRGDRSAAERTVMEAQPHELVTLLEGARPLE